MQFARCEQGLSNSRRLRNAIGVNMEVIEEDPGLQYLFFDKPCINMYLMQRGTHWTRALELETSHITAVRNQKFVR